MFNFLEPPRLRVGEDSSEERRATWLELFYDLVFVVAISQLAHNLKDDVSLTGFFGFVFLFIPVWWSWIGNTFYANRFDSDDVGRRLLVALQMLAAAAMAVNIHHGLDENAPAFAISYAFGRAVLVMEYVRAGLHITDARPLTTRYATGFAIAALIWLISATLPVNWRFPLWGVAIIIDFVTPFTARQHQLKLLPHASHLPERFGLFTTIVLGEAIVAVVDGVSHQKWGLLSVTTAVCGFAIAFSLWWVYFDNLGGTPIKKAQTDGKVRVMVLWLFTHLPLVIGIAAAGVSVEKILVSKQTQVLPDEKRWLLCGAIALCWLTIGILHQTGIIRYCKARSRYRIGAAMLTLVIGFLGSQLYPIAVIGLVAAVCLAQVVQDLYQSRPTTRLLDPEF